MGFRPRGLPLPVADVMESLFNSTFDHNGTKAPAAVCHRGRRSGAFDNAVYDILSGGNPPLFMDFRKVWETWEIKELAKKLNVKIDEAADMPLKVLSMAIIPVRRRSTGRQSRALVKAIMDGVSMPLADPGYFPGGGNSVTFMTPACIEGIAGRLAYSGLSGKFSLIWDEVHTTSSAGKTGASDVQPYDADMAAYLCRS